MASSNKELDLGSNDRATSSNPIAGTSEINVQGLHAPLQREYAEPRDGFEPIPFWMTTFFGILLFWGGMYISANSADYRSDVYDSPYPRVPGSGGGVVAKPEVMPVSLEDYIKLGERVYGNCTGCHQSTGEGGNGIPPLNKSEWVVGEKNSPARLARILLYGLNGPISVRGALYNGQMPAWGTQLKDHQIAGVLNYVRNKWDNKLDVLITTEMVAAARKKEGTRPTTGAASMTQALLEAIPVDYTDVIPPAKKDDGKKDDGKKGDATKDVGTMKK
jgi:mono/diheme cytochrome c family protein